jgi:thioredoxin reductase (NADPH)
MADHIDRVRIPLPRPVLLVLDSDAARLRSIRRDLRQEYGDRYRILTALTGREALDIVRLLAERNEDAALFAVHQQLPDMSGLDFLLEAGGYFPEARRVLCVAPGGATVGLAAINTVRLDHCLTGAWEPPQERVFPVLDDLLADWHATHHSRYAGLRVVGHRLSPATHRIRDFLTRNMQPFQFYEVERDAGACEFATEFGRGRLPLVIFPTGPLLAAPSIAELAGTLGLTTTASRPHYDMVIVGAGPAGLAASVYAASEGLTVLTVDAEVPGGQAGTSSRIENYLGFPTGLSGGDLTRRAVTQARRFGAEILHPVAVTGIRGGDPARVLDLSDGSEVSAETVLLAMGVHYHRLPVPGAERFENAGLYYGACITETASSLGRRVHIVGGANSAGQAAMHFSRYADTVVLLVRAGDLRQGMSQYLVQEIEHAPNIEVRTSTEVLGLDGGTHLERITLREGAYTYTEPAGLVFTFIGARPRTEWLEGLIERDANGFISTGPDLTCTSPRCAAWPLAREPLLLETSMPGVFAAGDVRSRSVKRVASSVGEGSMAVALIHQYRSE